MPRVRRRRPWRRPLAPGMQRECCSEGERSQGCAADGPRRLSSAPIAAWGLQCAPPAAVCCQLGSVTADARIGSRIPIRALGGHTTGPRLPACPVYLPAQFASQPRSPACPVCLPAQFPCLQVHAGPQYCQGHIMQGHNIVRVTLCRATILSGPKCARSATSDSVITCNIMHDNMALPVLFPSFSQSSLPFQSFFYPPLSGCAKLAQLLRGLQLRTRDRCQRKRQLKSLRHTARCAMLKDCLPAPMVIQRGSATSGHSLHLRHQACPVRRTRPGPGVGLAGAWGSLFGERTRSDPHSRPQQSDVMHPVMLWPAAA